MKEKKQVNKKEYYLFSKEDILKEFNSGEYGLSSLEAEERMATDGPNEFAETKRDSYFLIFIRQFKSPLIYILLISGFIVLLMNEKADTVVIFAVIFFNAIIGTLQEGKAQNTFLALKKFTKSNASVIRDGREVIIPDREVVAGDIISLREGEKVPADGRLIAVNNLKVSEAAFSGESTPKFKNADKLKTKNLSLIDQHNMVFKGSTVVGGSGRALVTATGMETVLGSIAKEALKIDTEFPLKNDINKLSRQIIFAVAGVAIVVLILGLGGGQSFREVLKMIIAISVSIIPEGLPVVMTLVLAVGVWRMGKKNVLVKKMQAVEVLGEVRVLAVDKTGTVTKNELMIKKVLVGNKIFEIGGIGYLPQGEVKLSGKIIEPLNHEEIFNMGKMAALNARANLVFDKIEKNWKISGDPTEGAMLTFAKKIGFNPSDLLEEMTLLDEIPFDYKSKIHTSLHKVNGENILITSGSPEEILALSDKEWQNKNSPKEIDSKRKEEIRLALEDLFAQGLRVIGIGYKEIKENKITGEEISNLVLLGFFGIQDALRKEVREAVRMVKDQGMKVVMITGDHKITAKSIAEEAGIFNQGDVLMSGDEIEIMSEGELNKKIKDVSVFYRVNPDHKLRIISAYQKNKMAIAMTGDGVNDALSLSAADIGIGMGKIGTEVAKESSDLILLDDNFGNITYGVEEGRNIFASIKKVVLYLVSTSVGEVFAILGALLLGWPLPILAAQILWLNLVTDGFLDVALALEDNPSDKERNSFSKKRPALIDSGDLLRIFLMALRMAIGTLFLFSQNYHNDINKAWTISLSVLAVSQWFNAWNCLDKKKSIFTINPFKKKFLIGATAIVFALQMLAIYNSFFQKMLKTVPLEKEDWVAVAASAFLIVVLEEIRKFFYRRKK